MIVEDHPVLRSLCTTVLASAGHQVISAANGSDAIALAEKHQPHLILMDYGLPDMTGVEAYKQILSAPVIFLSGYTVEKVSQEINTTWPASVMQKPFLIEDLQHAVIEGLTTGPKTSDLLQARK